MIRLQNVSFQWEEKGNGIKNIDLTIPSGEFVLITGESGCGKTTLGHCINGLIPHFFQGNRQGDVWINGQNIEKMPLHEIGRQVGSVFQDPRSQFFTTSTKEELTFGCKNMGLSKYEILNRLHLTTETLNLKDLQNRSVFTLSSGEKQRIALGSCYAMNPFLYLLDEPSANLDMDSTNRLRQVLKILQNQGKTIILIEHKLYYAADLADRLVIMKGGRIDLILDKKQIKGLKNEELAQKNIRAIHLNALPCFDSSTLDSTLLCRASNISFSHKKACTHKIDNFKKRPCEKKILNQLNLSLNSSQVIGLVGDNGAGKSTLARLLCGLEKEKEGCFLNGKNSIMTKKRRLKSSHFVIQDSDYQLFKETVDGELCLGLSKKVNKCDKFLKKKEHLVETLGLKPYLKSHPLSLSRGQKQRLTIACALLKNTKLLIFDEPTSGLDAQNMKTVSQLIRSATSDGKSCIVISHDYAFLLRVADEIAHLKAGSIAETFKLNEYTKSHLFHILKGDPCHV